MSELNQIAVGVGKIRSHEFGVISIRPVPLSEKAKEIPAARLARFDGENLFPQNDKDGMKEIYSFNVVHRKVVRLADFDFRIYYYRHTFATRAIEGGVNLVV